MFQIYAATVAKLYMAYPDTRTWAFMGVLGPVVLLKDKAKNSAFYFRTVDLQVLSLQHYIERDIN